MMLQPLTPARRRILDQPLILLIFTVITWCLISYNPQHYWDEYFYIYSLWQLAPLDLMKWEQDLSLALFPDGFFSAKIAFIILLRLLIGVSGDGYASLLWVQTAFALLVLATAAAAYGLVREVEPTRAWRPALVFLFLPVSIFFAFKTLSEVPAGFFGTVACWLFLRSFRSRERRFALLMLGLAAAMLCVAILMRFITVVLFAGMVAGLLAAGFARFPVRAVALRGACVSVVAALVACAVYAALGFSPADFQALIGSVTERTPGLALKLYAVAMTVQLFAVPCVLVLTPPWQRPIRFALVWLAIGAVPFVVASSYLEPRYFYMVMVPLGMVCSAGLDRLAGLGKAGSPVVRWLGLFAGIVILNRILFAPLMPYELNQRQYAQLVEHLEQGHPRAALLTSWITDYCFLRFAFPDEDVRLAYSKPHNSARQKGLANAGFHAWVGERRYVASPEDLTSLPKPRIFVGWSYNPVMLAIRKRLDLIGLGGVATLSAKEGLRGDHRSLSWIWSDPSLSLRLLQVVGPYQAYEIDAVATAQ
jgi:hypothetical protein